MTDDEIGEQLHYEGACEPDNCPYCTDEKNEEIVEATDNDEETESGE